MSTLLPDGIDHLGDCPYTLAQAIAGTLRILSYEEFPTEERPPRRIWMDGEKLKEHWDRVQADREVKYGPDASEAPPDESDWDGNAVSLITR